MSKAAAIRAVLETRTLRITGLAGSGLLGAGLCALSFLYFDWWMGVWLVALSVLAHSLPRWGLGILFLSVSMDLARPVVGQITISFSELQIAVFLSSWFGGSLWRKEQADPRLETAELGCSLPVDSPCVWSVFVLGRSSRTKYSSL